MRTFVRRVLLYRLFLGRKRYQLKNIRLRIKKTLVGTSQYWSVLELQAPLGMTRATHFQEGMVRIEDSPHFSFIKEAAHGSLSPQALTQFRDYHRAQGLMSEAAIREKEKAFVSLAELYRGNQAAFAILVKWEGFHEVFRVVDGFHRLAIMAAFAPDELVTLRVIK